MTVNEMLPKWTLSWDQLNRIFQVAPNGPFAYAARAATSCTPRLAHRHGEKTAIKSVVVKGQC